MIARTEKDRQHRAYEVYRDLGHGRTYREVARRVNASPQTIANWARLFDWNLRIQSYKSVVKAKEEAGEVAVVDDPVVRKLVTAMQRVEALIASAFPTDDNGVITSTVKITTADELTKLLTEYRHFLETYNKAITQFKPDNPRVPKNSTNIERLTVMFGDMPQEKRIELMKGVMNGNDEGRNKQSEGRVQDADFAEVPGQGDEDGHGRNGVPGGVADSDSGDETHL